MVREVRNSFYLEHYNIRTIINVMSKIGTHTLIFGGYGTPECKVYLYTGNPKDEYSSISIWKKIDGEYVCRHIHAYIPPELQLPEFKPYAYGSDEFILPERFFNMLLKKFHLDHYMAITAPSYCYHDMMSTMMAMDEDF